MISHSLFTGFSKLASSNLAAGMLNLLALAIAARSLDLVALGIIVLIQTYVRVVDGFFNFQSVNVLTRFLAATDPTVDVDQFRGLVKAGFIVDVLTAVLACGLATAALPVIGVHVGIPVEWTGPAMLFSLVILTRISGVTEAVLRCFDHFWAIGLRGVFTASLILVGSLAAWRSRAGAEAFLAVWMMSEAVANLAFLAWTLVVLRKKGILGIRRGRASNAIRRAPGFWSILWQTNLTFGIRLLSQDADLLVAGAVLGSAPAGLLRAAKSIASMLDQIGRPLQQVASAPIARLSAAGDYAGMLRYAKNVCLTATLFGFFVTTCLLFLGADLLAVLFGEDYTAAEIALIVIAASRAIYLSGVALLPTMLSLDMGKQFLYSTVIGTLVFFAVLFITVLPFGLVGIGVAHVAFCAAWAFAGWRWVFRRVVTAGLHRPHGESAG